MYRDDCSPSNDPFLAYACLKDPQDRAKASFDSGVSLLRTGHPDDAEACLRRAWDLGLFSWDIFVWLYKALFGRKAFDDAIILCHEAAFVFAGNIKYLEEIFQMRANIGYHYPMKAGYYFDRIIFDLLNSAYRVFSKKSNRCIRGNRSPIRIGYILWGEWFPGSSLLKNVHALVQAQDPAEFDAVIYSNYGQEDLCEKNPDALQFFIDIQKNKYKYQVFAAYDLISERIDSMQRMIEYDEIDILVFSCQIGFYSCLAMRRPAPLLVALNNGSPEAYTSPAVDLALSWTVHPALEALCKQVLIKTVAPELPVTAPHTRDVFGVSEDDIILLTSGSIEKFTSVSFWDCVNTILERAPNAKLFVCGTTDALLGSALDSLASYSRKRVLFLGMRNDLQRFFPMVDIYLDTFPAGGGHAVFEAMWKGLPVASLKPRISGRWSNRSWTPAMSFFGDDIAIPCGRLDLYIERVCDLINNADLRDLYGRKSLIAISALGRTNMGTLALDAIRRAWEEIQGQSDSPN